METIWVKAGVVALFVVYLIALQYRRRKEKAEMQEAEAVLRERVINTLGADAWEKLQKQMIWEGMPESLVYYVYGRPDEEERRDTPGKAEKTFYYYPIANPRKNARMKFKLKIEALNGVVKDWEAVS